MHYPRLRNLIALCLTIAMVALPHYAEARAGGGRSMGSRGTQTFQSVPSASPIDRTTTARPATVPSGNTGFTSPPPSGGGFWSGMAGGFLGAGLASMLFGHGGGYGGSGMFGGLLPMLLLGYLGYYLYKRFSGRGFASPMSGFAMDSNYTSPTHFSAAPVSQTLTVTEDDKKAFEQLLLQIQHLWSEGDLTRMRQYITPEMLQYFSEELSANASRGLANKVERVQLTQADIVESWHEYELDYATAKLTWSATDYMVRLDREPSAADYVASGSATIPETATEIWTFARAAGGHWLLSAIQQVGET